MAKPTIYLWQDEDNYVRYSVGGGPESRRFASWDEARGAIIQAFPEAEVAKGRPPGKTYVVEGPRVGEFPVDMLRHDDAKALTEEDAALIERLNAYEGKEDLPKKVRISLLSAWRGAPNVKRWESFGWRVVECSDPFVELSKAPVEKFRSLVLPVAGDDDWSAQANHLGHWLVYDADGERRLTVIDPLPEPVEPALRAIIIAYKLGVAQGRLAGDHAARQEIRRALFRDLDSRHLPEALDARLDRLERVQA